MYKKLVSNAMIVVSVLAVLALFSSTTLADDPVFRNDFICYDTLDTECFDRNAWNDVSLDSIGNISQINSSSLFAGAILFNQFNRFDRFGDQTLPVNNFMPDTLCLDTIWGVASRIHCYTNEGRHDGRSGAGELRSGQHQPF